jgi:broad specificity phosphatase PhoE
VGEAGLRGSLLLLRHGETEWTRARRVMGRQPVPLSEAGRAQCGAVLPLLRALAPARVITSPLTRARETADIVAAALACPVEVDDDLAEFDFGSWEGQEYAALLQDPTYLAFARGPLETTPPGGESLRAAQTRALRAVARAFETTPGARVCMVTHGDLIRLVLASFLALDLREYRRIRVDTCGLSAVDLTGDWAEGKFMNQVADPARVCEHLHWGR